MTENDVPTEQVTETNTQEPKKCESTFKTVETNRTTVKPCNSNKENPSAANQMTHFLRIKEIVKKSIVARHTFMIHGRSRVIRESLLARGWCEKLYKKTGEQPLGVESNPSALLAGIGNLNEKQNERLLISKMLGNHTVDFLWNAGSEWTGWPSQDNKTTIFNRFTRANFTSKVGLCSNVRQMHWYYEAGIANTLFPRCYNLSQPDQMHAFIDDYRLTACLSLLKWFVDKIKAEGEEAIRTISGIVPVRALEFAIGRCTDFIGSKSHEDIDQEPEKVWSHQWEQFITWYYKLLHGNALFVSNSTPFQKYMVAAQHLLKRAKIYWPQLDMDGVLNIWILKPGNKSRGRGIVLMNKLDDILAKINPSNKATDTRFVVQKYIERPLLIYETKFDIRQWFIVTNAQPLTLWMYRESYLRFCSQKFSLTDFHESIHLSNNAVQCKYKNCDDRDTKLPNENMWDVTAFKEYLKSRGDANAWDELIYPGMKQGLVGSLLASQEAMDRRKNSFELYGADFMVMEDYSVWLIEINSHPDMSSSTSVTTRLCRKAMEDTIKVVIDHRENPEADTGDFELVYKQKLSPCQAYLGTGLTLHGTRIVFGDKRPNNGSTNTTVAPNKKKMSTSATASTGSQETNRMGPVLMDLIEELELKLDHEFYEFLRLHSGSGLTRQSLPLRENITSCQDKQYLDVGVSVSALGSSSHSMTTKGSAKNSPSKKSGKHKVSTNQSNIEDSSSEPQTTQSLMSKIMDLQKETGRGKSTGTGKLSRQNKTNENSAFKNESKVNVNLKIEKKSISSKLLPVMQETEVNLPRSAMEGRKIHRMKKRSRAKSSQVLIDVDHMLAVGFSVNK